MAERDEWDAADWEVTDCATVEGELAVFYVEPDLLMAFDEFADMHGKTRSGLLNETMRKLVSA